MKFPKLVAQASFFGLFFLFLLIFKHQFFPYFYINHYFFGICSKKYLVVSLYSLFLSKLIALLNVFSASS